MEREGKKLAAILKRCFIGLIELQIQDGDDSYSKSGIDVNKCSKCIAHLQIYDSTTFKRRLEI